MLLCATSHPDSTNTHTDQADNYLTLRPQIRDVSRIIR